MHGGQLNNEMWQRGENKNNGKERVPHPQNAVYGKHFNSE